MRVPAGTRPRPIAFILVSALLVASGVVFARSAEFQGEAGDGARGAAPHAAAVQTEQRARQVEAETARLHAQVERSARRFLKPFFRYEVGDIDAGVRRELRATATPQFAAALLAVPPRPPAGAGFPPRARPQELEVTFASAGAFSAFVDGTARRGGVVKEFSFEFEYLRGHWRASGVTE